MIRIYYHNNILFGFYDNINHFDNYEEKCEKCGEYYLSSKYVEIIDELKRKNLLPKNFKKICCYCYSLFEGIENED